MDYLNYERLNHIDPSFPVIFHHYIANVQLNDKYLFWEHWHESIELLYFIKGSGSVSCDFNSFPVSAGDLVILNTNEVHYLKAISEPLDYYCLIVDPTLLGEFIPDITSIIFKTLAPRDEFFKSAFDSISQELSNKKHLYKIATKAIIINLFVHLTRFYVDENAALIKKDTSTKKDGSFDKITIVKNALKYMNNNYSQNISTDDICEHIGYSKFYFCRIFKELTNKTSIEYLNQLRCHKAHKFLSSGKLSVAQIAELCGFYSVAYFSKTYKKYFGFSPSKHKA